MREFESSPKLGETEHARYSGGFSGEGGIRTHGGPKSHNGFRDRPIQPLWHLSRFRVGCSSAKHGCILHGGGYYILNVQACVQFRINEPIQAIKAQAFLESRCRIRFSGGYAFFSLQADIAIP